MRKYIEYENKWVGLMLSENPSDKKSAEKEVMKFYSLCRQEAPSVFIWMASPYEVNLACYILHQCDCIYSTILKEYHQKKTDLYSDSTWKSVWLRLEPSLPCRFQPLKVRKVWEAICRQTVTQFNNDKKWDQIDRSLEELLYFKNISVWDRLGNTIDQERRARATKKRSDENTLEVSGSLERMRLEHIRGEIVSEISRVPTLNGNIYSRPSLVATRHRFYLYEWYNDMFKLGYKEHLDIVMKIAENCYNWITVKNACIMIENPVRVECNAEGLLHSEGSMAIEFNDGFGLWRLNGVRVSEKIVMTPSEELSSKSLIDEKNGEVRREIVRKIGIEKVCKELEAKSIDRWENYELLLLRVGDKRKRPYLKMLNPSIGTYHIEGVAPGCRSVKSALAWRNGLKAYNLPEALT